MIRVKMTKSVNGSTDGITVNRYKENEEYELPESLADIFLREKMAVKLEEEVERPQVSRTKRKSLGAAPENKGVGDEDQD